MSTTFTRSLDIQRRVFWALFIREIKTRFGAWRLGYAWAFLEPMAHLSVFLFLFAMGGRSSPPGMPFPLFLLTGILPFFAFRSALNVSTKAIESNAGLFNYHRVKPYDAVLVRVFLECLLSFVVFCVLAAAFHFYGGTPVQVGNVPAYLGTLLLFYLFSLGIGTCASVMGVIFPETQRMVPLLSRPLYFLSGIFFVARDLPEQLQEILFYNPVFHALELLRTFFFTTYQTPGGSFFYLGAWTLCSNALGLALFWRYRFRLVAA